MKPASDECSGGKSLERNDEAEDAQRKEPADKCNRMCNNYYTIGPQDAQKIEYSVRVRIAEKQEEILSPIQGTIVKMTAAIESKQAEFNVIGLPPFLVQ